MDGFFEDHRQRDQGAGRQRVHEQAALQEIVDHRRKF
jgi:hypothetical protein